MSAINEKVTNSLSRILNRPLAIGNKTIPSRLVLAPMALLGNIAFREILSDFGGYGLLFSEMCSAKRIRHENRRVSPYFRWRDEERSHLVWQIYGNDPDIMAEAAARIEWGCVFVVGLRANAPHHQVRRRGRGTHGRGPAVAFYRVDRSIHTLRTYFSRNGPEAIWTALETL